MPPTTEVCVETITVMPNLKVRPQFCDNTQPFLGTGENIDTKL